MESLISAFGLVCMIGFAWLMSSHRGRMPWRIIISGVLLQFIFGILILWTPPGRWAMDGIRIFFTQILSFSDAGAEMAFGTAFRDHFFAFSVLPTIIFVSCLMSILFYWGIIQRVVQALSRVMCRIMDVSGAEGLAASANIFVGQTEAPLVIKPYIATMTRSEIMAMMTGGFATVAGGVMAAFVGFGADAGHLLAASVMSAPASLVIAKIMLPELEKSPTKGVVRISIPIDDHNVLDAACRGASEGLKLALNVLAMLIAFVALAALINYGMSFFPQVGGENLSVERILGWAFAPMAWLIGVESSDVLLVGQLLGKKMFLNEFLAFLDLRDLQGSLSPRSFTLATYALCGFANFSSIAIQIGGIGALVPERRKDLASLGFRAMLGGTLAANMTACIAGIFI
jgi:CNT family concentrative nucleoside transporter